MAAATAESGPGPCRCPVCANADVDREVDLSGLTEDARTIRVDCVVRAILARGLQLRGARIDGVVGLDYQSVAGPVRLRRCEIAGVSANNTSFGNVVDFTASSFAGDLDLLGATFERVVLIDGLSAHCLTLWSTRLKSGLSAKRIHLRGCLNAREMSVEASAAFDGADFAGEVSFRRAHVGQTLSLVRAHATMQVMFNGATLSDLDLTGATFASDVFLRAIHVAETLRIHRGDFRSTVCFDECEVCDLEFGPASRIMPQPGEPPAAGPEFHGPVTFRGGTVSATATIENTTFWDDVLIDDLRVGGWALSGTTFHGGMAVRDLRADRNFAIARCGFTHELVAENLTVAGMAVFQDLAFEGAVEMKGATFACDAQFRNVRCRRLDLSSANVAGSLVIEGDDVAARVGVGNDDALELKNVTVAQDVRLGIPVAGDVELYGLTVKGSLDVTVLRVTAVTPPPPAAPGTGSVYARFLTVSRDLTFGKSVRVAGTLDLTGASVAGTLKFETDRQNLELPACILLEAATLGTLAFDGPPPTVAVDLDMVGCTYGNVRADASWLMDHLHRQTDPRTRRSMPDRQPFLKLESVLRNGGDDEVANRVFYEGRWRTRWKSAGIQWLPQLVFSGFGVRPWYLLMWIFGLWLVPTVFFSTASGSVRDLSLTARTNPTSKVVQSVDDRQHSCGDDRLNPFRAALLSLELFVPATFPNTDFVAAPSCAVTFGPLKIGSLTIGPLKIQPWITAVVLFALKLGGLILIPLAVVTISGVLRPSPRG